MNTSTFCPVSCLAIIIESTPLFHYIHFELISSLKYDRAAQNI